MLCGFSTSQSLPRLPLSTAPLQALKDANRSKKPGSLELANASLYIALLDISYLKAVLLKA